MRMLLGIDICSTDRMRKALERSPFLQDEIFSPDEVACCERTRDPEMHLAARWAAKEACIKALGLNILGYDLSRIEVTHDGSGRPALRVSSAELQEKIEEISGPESRLHLSISHENDYALACVIVTPCMRSKAT